MSKFTDDLVRHVLAGVPALRVDTNEEGRAVQEVVAAPWRLTKGKKYPLDADTRATLVKAFTALPDGQGDGLIEGDNLLVEGKRLQRLLPELSRDVVNVLERAVVAVGYRIITWDVVRGFSDAPGSAAAHAEDPKSALLATASPDRFRGHIIFIFKDCAPYLGHQAEDPQPRRVLKELVETVALLVERKEGTDRRTLVFMQPHWRPHPDIAHYLVSVDFAMADAAAIDREISYAEHSIGRDDVKVSPEIRHLLKSTLTGLTQYEITNILSIAAVAHGGFNEETVRHVQKLKAKTFEREESLAWIDPENIPPIESFAGFDNLLDWVYEAREAYTEEAQAAGLKPDKGMLLLGIPGTGKSLVAMAIAKVMGLPLIKFDFGSILGSFVGQSEENMRRVLRRVNGEGRCVLFIDEADKAFSNVLGPQAGSNVEQHVFGQLISWMANDNKWAFVIMTMNRTKGVPVEMLRSGRISGIWSTTFPTAIEREEILRLKLVDNNCDPSLFTEEQYLLLAQKTDQYVGAELEEVVKKAVKTAWRRRKAVQPTFAEMQASVSRVRPVAALDEANIIEINEFCKGKAEPVARPKEKARPIQARPRRSVDLGEN